MTITNEENPQDFLTEDEELLLDPALRKSVAPVDPDVVDKDCGC